MEVHLFTRNSAHWCSAPGVFDDVVAAPCAIAQIISRLLLRTMQHSIKGENSFTLLIWAMIRFAGKEPYVLF